MGINQARGRVEDIKQNDKLQIHCFNILYKVSNGMRRLKIINNFKVLNHHKSTLEEFYQEVNFEEANKKSGDT